MTVGLVLATLVAVLVRPNMLPFMALAALLSMPLLPRKRHGGGHSLLP